MVRSATQFPMVLPWFNHDFFFFFFFFFPAGEISHLTFFFFFFFCEISHPKISPWETLFDFMLGQEQSGTPRFDFWTVQNHNVCILNSSELPKSQTWEYQTVFTPFIFDLI